MDKEKEAQEQAEFFTEDILEQKNEQKVDKDLTMIFTQNVFDTDPELKVLNKELNKHNLQIKKNKDDELSWIVSKL